MNQGGDSGSDPQGLGDRLARAPEPDAQGLMQRRIKSRLFPALAQPVKVARFTLIRAIGAGAMGEVHLGYDETLDRKVAVKLVHTHASGSSARHLREAKALAKLSHPNVVQIYDAGLFEGAVFIAMELIAGSNLRAWLQALEQAPQRQRQRLILDRFVQAGRGLEAAHRAGVTHRDFKPENVLVGDDGRVRVADFGLARMMAAAAVAPPDSSAASATGDAETPVRTPASAATASAATASAATVSAATVSAATVSAAAPPRGANAFADTTPAAPGPESSAGLVAGTPAYMAPEQLRGLAADSRSDQFSFCVALYEALRGALPYPAGPRAERLAAIAQGRLARAPGKTDKSLPAPVRKALVRGLAAKPDDRYPTMGALLRDLTRDSRRRRRLLLAAALVSLGLATGAVAARGLAPEPSEPCRAAAGELDPVWSPELRARARAAFANTGLAYASDTWERVDRALGRYVSRWHGERVAVCQATHVRRTQSPELFALRNLCLDQGKRALTALSAELERAGAGAVERAVAAAAALPAIDSCRDGAALALGVLPPVGAELAARVEASRERLARAEAAELAGRMAEATELAEAEVPVTAAIAYTPVRAEALARAAALRAQQKTPEDTARAEDMLWQALDLAEAARHDELAAQSWNALVRLVGERDPTPERALLFARRALAAAERTAAPDRPRARALLTLGRVFYRDNRLDEAEDAQRRGLASVESVLGEASVESLGEAPGDTFSGDALLAARFLQDLGNTLHGRNRLAEAGRFYEDALAISSRELGGGHPRVGNLCFDFGLFLLQTGELPRAAELIGRAAAVWTAAYGPEHYDVGSAHLVMANIEYEMGQFSEALAHARAARGSYEANLEPGDRRLAEPVLMQGMVEFARGEYAAARAAWQEALAIQRKTLAADHYRVLITRSNLGEALVQLGRPDEALAEYTAMTPAVEAVAGERPLLHALVLKGRGQAHLRRGQARAAAALLRRSLDILSGQPGNDLERAAVLWSLAQALESGESGDVGGGQPGAAGPGQEATETATEMAEEARGIFAGRGRAREIVQIVTWLERRR